MTVDLHANLHSYLTLVQATPPFTQQNNSINEHTYPVPCGEAVS